MLDTELDQDIQIEVEPEIPVSLNPVLVDLGYTLLIPTTLEQQQSLEELLGKDTQVIRVLAAGTREHIKDGVLTWQSPGFECNDNNGLCSGGVYRVAAGAIAMKILPDAKIIVGSKYADDRQPPPSIVMKEELEMLGLEEERIISDPDTLDTIAELVRMVEICEENGWSNGVCITNEYHCARAQTLLYNLSWLSFETEKTESFLRGLERIRRGELNIRVVPAEEIVKRYSKEIFDTHISNHLESPSLEQRKERERAGVNMIAIGEYQRNNQILRRSDNPSLTLI